jgi:hypothetical protein
MLPSVGMNPWLEAKVWTSDEAQAAEAIESHEWIMSLRMRLASM